MGVCEAKKQGMRLQARCTGLQGATSTFAALPKVAMLYKSVQPVSAVPSSPLIAHEHAFQSHMGTFTSGGTCRSRHHQSPGSCRRGGDACAAQLVRRSCLVLQQWEAYLEEVASLHLLDLADPTSVLQYRAASAPSCCGFSPFVALAGFVTLHLDCCSSSCRRPAGSDHASREDSGSIAPMPIRQHCTRSRNAGDCPCTGPCRNMRADRRSCWT